MILDLIIGLKNGFPKLLLDLQLLCYVSNIKTTSYKELQLNAWLIVSLWQKIQFIAIFSTPSQRWFKDENQFWMINMLDWRIASMLEQCHVPDPLVKNYGDNESSYGVSIVTRVVES